jgi:hypothetical protein
LKKQELKNETSLKGWFCFGTTNVTAGQAVRCNLYVFKKHKGFTLPSFMLPILNNIVFVIASILH